jgi:hypothetical protein
MIISLCDVGDQLSGITRKAIDALSPSHQHVFILPSGDLYERKSTS